jgi:phenylacetate-CoA ligase
MILIKGTNVFPSTIEEIIKRFPELGNDFMIVLDEIGGTYELIIQVEPATHITCTESMEQQIQNKLVEMCREQLRLRPVVQVMPCGSLPRYELKSKRVIDKRVKEN